MLLFNKNKLIDQIYFKIMGEIHAMEQRGERFNSLCYSVSSLQLIGEYRLKNASYERQDSAFFYGRRISLGEFNVKEKDMPAIMKGLAERFGPEYCYYEDWHYLSGSGSTSSVRVSDSTGETVGNYTVTTGSGSATVQCLFVCRKDDYLNNRKSYVAKSQKEREKIERKRIKKSLKNVR